MSRFTPHNGVPRCEGFSWRLKSSCTQYSLSDAYRLIGDRGTRLPESLLPFCVVDEASIACVLTQDDDYYATGEIVRVFLTDVEHRFQCALLDMHPLAYMTSLEEELPARDEGLRRVLDEIGPAYQDAYLAKEKRPRDFVIRPVRIACQNVIVGLAAFAQDSTFDGLVGARPGRRARCRTSPPTRPTGHLPP